MNEVALRLGCGKGKESALLKKEKKRGNVRFLWLVRKKKAKERERREFDCQILWLLLWPKVTREGKGKKGLGMVSKFPFLRWMGEGEREGRVFLLISGGRNVFFNLLFR